MPVSCFRDKFSPCKTILFFFSFTPVCTKTISRTKRSFLYFFFISLCLGKNGRVSFQIRAHKIFFHTRARSMQYGTYVYGCNLRQRWWQKNTNIPFIIFSYTTLSRRLRKLCATYTKIGANYIFLSFVSMRTNFRNSVSSLRDSFLFCEKNTNEEARNRIIKV